MTDVGFMEIQVKLLCIDVPPDKSCGAVSLTDIATVERALELYSEKYKLNIPLDTFKKSLFLINKSPASLESTLQSGDVLTVIRTLAGG